MDTMLELNLPDLSCGHCVRAVTETLHQLDPQAEVSIDLPHKQLQVQTQVEPARVIQALVDAGYPPA
jgi:copper chaperone